MSNNKFKGFEDFINYCNNFYNENTNNSSQSSSSANEGYYCGDIPGGFQAIDPQFFLIISELLANVVAGKMPFNIQNVIGNWLQLVGQAIETYNTQQQYMQAGPGRYYDIRNLNINNPFCSWNQNSSGRSSYDDSSQYINYGQNSSDSSDEFNQSGYNSEINDMKEVIKDLRHEIEELKQEMIEIKKNVK